MDFCVLTLFPEVFSAYMDASIPGRAQDSGIIDFRTLNIRDFSNDKHKRVDDYPFGGGAGLVMTPQPLFDCIAKAKATMPEGSKVIYMSPCGQKLDHAVARQFSQLPGLILLCGHYEGIDQRVIDQLVDAEISIGDYVLTGGELPAMVTMDAVMRFLPGVLGNDDAHEDESFEQGKLEAPQYTRPADYNGWEVPEVLRSGNHAKILEWKSVQALERTRLRRPDLLDEH